MDDDQTDKRYGDYVPHPRYGQGPRFTGLDCSFDEIASNGISSRYRWHNRVPGTAIKADLSRQSFRWEPLVYYFDSERTCCDCQRPFLFFAEEQKHWHEVLEFYIGADARRCVPCRKVDQNTSRLLKRYEELVNQERAPDQQLAFAELTMTLMERRAIGLGPMDKLRGAIKRVPDAQQRAVLKERLKPLLERDHKARA